MERLYKKGLTCITGVGEKRARLFQKLGVDSVGALLHFYPRAYENWSDTVSVFNAAVGQPVFIRAVVLQSISEHRIRKGMTLYKTVICDHSGAKVQLTFFNNPYISRMLRCGEEYIFHGRLTVDRGRPQMNSPSFMSADTDPGTIPVYPLTEGLSSKLVSQTVSRALEMLPDTLIDPLPEETRVKRELCPLAYALKNIHFPESDEALAAARKRLVFDELLQLQLGLLTLKGRDRGQNSMRLTKDCTEEFFARLPFEPTGAQRRAVGDAMRDMTSSEHPMSRLLQGDVGSGKTAVAAALCYNTARCGMQSALMVPTEILAAQHFSTLSRFLSAEGISVALLTGSVGQAEKRRIREGLTDGSIDVVVGTHALISDGVEFRSLALVITDEQHRFGVKQRAALSSKGNSPHHLVMSATPIPRTLALMIFGDLDVSVLDEMPKGRIPVETFFIDSSKRERAYNFIKKHADNGFQSFVVCPLIEDENETGLASAVDFAEELSEGYLKGCNVGLLHGKMKPAEKDEVMGRFLSGELSVLVSTTVIEVGVDVPNAVIMLIENAERFGLSQLHQLRGRVGRGNAKSYCILVSDSKGETARSRLRTMTSTTDGFKIANEDLKLRGPGDFFGARQHGLPQLQIADLYNDMTVFSAAQEEARSIIEADPSLENNPELAAAVRRLYDGIPAFN
ncbi:MAG: ATP-dependent DNA helicase RecG [Clostridia bacterium]|nr:ATP-dependent DNA helicase RecG [Clostridia bacterium]